jgi:hypothetical protein
MLGYEFLLLHIPLRMIPPAKPARIRPVTRVEDIGELLAVPRHVAPPAGAPVLDHVLFALKYETLQPAILIEAMKLVPETELLAALDAQRQGSFLRKAAFFWEKATGRQLSITWEPSGNYIGMFDPAVYFTGQNWERNTRLRVDWNGIGPFEFSPVVLRDAALENRSVAILDRLHAWAADPANLQILDRVMGWAYLAETRDSYAIEQETPSPSKEAAFLNALKQLQDRTPLSEQYLADLQNIAVTRGAEAGFRAQQNWLQRGGTGALAVRYVPPSPDAMASLMDGFMRMANAEDDVPPLIKAAVVSFGFVYIHPFMDGNGRLSRLLAHHCLNYKGALPLVQSSPALLPLSAVMKKHEAQYLATLEAFSKPARQLWDVTYIAEGDFDFIFQSAPSIYAHFAADVAAAFIVDCAEQALVHSLVEEASFIAAYDRAHARINAAFDLPDRTVNLLIQWVQQNHFQFPNRRRNATELAGLTDAQIEKLVALVAEGFQAAPPSPGAP